MIYKKFCCLYSTEIYREYTNENVYETLHINFDNYMKMKYENFIEELGSNLKENNDGNEV